MARMSVAYKTVKYKAITTSKNQAQIVDPNSGPMFNEHFISAQFEKFDIGTAVECTFRMSEKTEDLQLLTVTEIPSGLSFQLCITGATTGDLTEIFNIFWEEIEISWNVTAYIVEALIEDFNRSSTEDEPYFFSPPLDYDVAITWQRKINNKFLTSKFTVFIHRAQKKNAFWASYMKTIKHAAKDESSSLPILTLAPEDINGHVLSTEERVIFGGIKNRMTIGSGQFNLLLVGGSGYGKTSKAKALAEFLGHHYLEINCALVSDTAEWFGFQEAVNGSTVFQPTEFTKRLQEGNVVICLDEANRIEPYIANSLFPLLGHQRTTSVHNMVINSGPNVVFCLTVNLGYKYVGTHMMDGAFVNRIDATIEVSPMPIASEKDLVCRTYPMIGARSAEIVVEVISSLRKIAETKEIDSIDFSTRTTLKVCGMLNDGISIQDAFKYVCINGSPIEDRKPVQDAINISINRFENP